MHRGDADMPAARLTKASVRNAILGVTESGLQPSAMEFLADGSMRFEFYEGGLVSNVGSFANLDHDQEPLSWEEAI